MTATATMEAKAAFERVVESAEAIRNDEQQCVGTVSKADCVRQGDIYLVAIGKLPATRTPRADRQLAPGTTQGSRHVLIGEVEVFDADKAEVAKLIHQAGGTVIPVELIGPVFQTGTETQAELDHPEHGNFVLPKDECFAVVYQRLFALEVKRQQD